MKKRSGKLMSVFGMIAVLAISLAGCDLFGQKRVEVSKPEIVVDGVNVSITCETEGAEIMYKIDSGDVKKYEGVFTLTQNRAETEYTIEAYAVKDGVESETSKKKAVIPGSTKTFIVTFVNGEDKTEVKVLEDDAVEAVTVTKEGYTFKCWLNGDEEYDLEAGVTSDLTLTACWSAVEYKITYDVGEGTNAEANPAVYTIESEDITLAAATGPASKPNFVAWHTTAAPAEGAWGDKVTGVAIKKGSTGDKTFYAEFSDKTVYTVSFYDGDTLLKEESVEEGKAAEASQEKKEGYSFGGWFADAALTTAADLSSVTANVKVYAKYTIITYSVTFYSADGTEIPSQTVNHGAKASVPTTSLGSRTGFTANGKWYADGKEFDFDTAITADTSLAAGWKYDTDVVIQTGAEAIELNKNGNMNTVSTSLPDDFSIKAGDVYTIKINGVSKYAFSNLKVAIIDNAIDTTVDEDGKTVESWGYQVLAESTVLQESCEEKGVVDASVEVVAKVSALGTGAGSHKVNLSCKDDTNNTCIYDTLANLEEDSYEGVEYEATISFTSPSAKLAFNAGGNNYQNNSAATWGGDISSSTVLKKRDTIKVTVEGSVNIDVTNLGIYIVDETEAGGWWNVLTDTDTIASSIAAESDFSKEITFTIKKNQIGTGNSAHAIVVCAKLEDGATAENNNEPRIFEKGHDFNSTALITKVNINETVDLTEVGAYSGLLMYTIADYLPDGKDVSDFDYVVLNVTFKDAEGNEVLYSEGTQTGQVVLLGEGDWTKISSIGNLNKVTSEFVSVYCHISPDLKKLALQNSGTNCASMTVNFIDWVKINAEGATCFTTAEDAITDAVTNSKTLVIGYTMSVAGHVNWGIADLVDDGWAAIADTTIFAASYSDCGQVLEAEIASVSADAKRVNLYNGAGFLYAYTK